MSTAEYYSAVDTTTTNAQKHYYNKVHTGLLDLGLKPTKLTDDVMDEMMNITLRYKDSIVDERIFRGVQWQK